MDLQLAQKWRATFMEAWPTELWDFAAPATQVPLSRQDRLILGSATPDFAQAFDLPGRLPGPPAMAGDLAQAVEDTLPSGAFLRLGSASFKRPDVAALPISTGDAALGLVGSVHPRASAFIADSLTHDYPLSLFVTEWVDIPPWAEFRLFIRDGQMVGASQYRSDAYFPEVEANLPQFAQLIWAFWLKLQPHLPLPDVIVDVYIALDTSQEPCVRLTELNPFIRRADPCLFSWRQGGDFDGSFRINMAQAGG